MFTGSWLVGGAFTKTDRVNSQHYIHRLTIVKMVPFDINITGTNVANSYF